MKNNIDNVNHPAHYNKGKFETIDVIEDWNLNFNLGNTVKYIARAEYKNSKFEDLQKAKWYLDRECSKAVGEENILNKAINKFGVDAQLGVVQEELSELIQAISKFKRGKEHNISEEMADVTIMLEQLRIIFNNQAEVDEIRKEKIERLQNII